MTRKQWLSLVLLACVFINSQNAFADNTQIGRYITVSNKPKLEQIDLLQQVMQVRFPSQVQTIGDAMHYLLKTSGYSLVGASKQSEALKITLSKPLPIIDRDFGPMSLKDGLTTLAGQAFFLVQDPLNRVIDFKLKPAFVRS